MKYAHRDGKSYLNLMNSDCSRQNQEEFRELNHLILTQKIHIECPNSVLF